MASSLIFPEIFNLYHLSLLLTSLNCVADPALYCFVSESARHGLYRVIFRPVAGTVCYCCHHGNASPDNHADDSHKVDHKCHPAVMLLAHPSTVSNIKTDAPGKNTILITQTEDKTSIPLIVENKQTL